MSILAQIQSRNNNFEDIFPTYKEDNTTYEMDPLVLSVAAKELANDDSHGYYNLSDIRVRSHVNDSHISVAEDIRKYFSKKFFWSNLSGNRPLSDFRQRVCYLLENRIKVCKETDNGIYYKLPYFYDEDMIYEDLKRQYNTVDIPGLTFPREKSLLNLRYIKETTSRQNKRNLHRFWFTDETYLYSIILLNDNPLLGIFRQLVIDKLTVSLETHYNVDRIDQMYFYKLHNFTLAKETHA
jgi:hypothetical protein